MKIFLDILNKKVQRFKTSYKLSEGKAFGMWLATEYLGLDEDEAFEAVSVDGGNRIAILKRGAAFFILAVVGILLHERNGQTFLNKLKPEVAASNATKHRLENYSTVALEWYVEIMADLVAAKEEVAPIVRSQTGWQKIKPKIMAKWKVYRLSRRVMEEALPKF